MRKFWLSPKTIGFVFPLLVGIAFEVGGWVNSTAAYALFVVASVWAACALIYWWRNIKGKRSEITTKESELLALPDALHALGELDVKLIRELGQNKRKEARSKLKNILSRLQKDWEIKPSKTYKNLSEQARRDAQDIVNQTVKKMGLSYTSVNEETMMFMLHIAGVLDDENIGISEQREKDDRYKLVMKLQSRVATQELNDTIRVYQRYSLGINSILLFISYCPTEYASLVMKEFGHTSTELRAEREQTLRFLLTNISGLLEKELYGKK